jgi:hypothetical protein
MPPTPRSKHSSAKPSILAHALAIRADKVPREYLLDDAPVLPGLALRQVTSLGPIGVDGGEPAVALFQCVTS